MRSSSSWKERSSHKREGAGSNPASATNHESKVQSPMSKVTETLDLGLETLD